MFYKPVHRGGMKTKMTMPRLCDIILGFYSKHIGTLRKELIICSTVNSRKQSVSEQS